MSSDSIGSEFPGGAPTGSDFPGRAPSDAPTKGKMVVLASPSGGGKSTMKERLLRDFPGLRFSVSATTRKPRQNEQDGREYFFLSDEEFAQKVQQEHFLEWEEVYGGIRYGTLRSEVEKMLEKGYFLMFDLDVLGAMSVKKIFDDRALTIYLKPPSMSVLHSRLVSRGTETEEQIRVRLERASKEAGYEPRFDKVVVNDDLEQAYRELHHLVNGFLSS